MPRLTLNGLSYHYALDGDGPAALLLHAAGLDLTVWEPLAAALRPRYAVLRADLRGHGATEPCYAPFSLGAFAADMHELLDALSLRPVAVVGHGLGGLVARELAGRWPADVATLVLANTPLRLSDPQRAQLRAAAARIEAGELAEVVADWLQELTAPAAVDTARLAQLEARWLATRPRGWLPALRAMADLDSAESPGPVSAPTLIIDGTLDPWLAGATRPEPADPIPGARYVEIAGATHWLPFEQPEPFAAAVARWLDEHLPGSWPSPVSPAARA